MRVGLGFEFSGPCLGGFEVREIPEARWRSKEAVALQGSKTRTRRDRGVILHAHLIGRRVAGQEIAKWGVARGVRVGLDRESVREGAQVATRVHPLRGWWGATELVRVEGQWRTLLSSSWRL